MKPNVIVIMADDQGSVDAGCYGAKDLVTPADGPVGRARRAIHAVLFGGSRLFALAGGLAHGPLSVAGRECQTTAPRPPTEADDQLDTLTGPGLPATEITLADMFRAAGYATAHIGKWHLGSGVGHKPLDHGFDYSFGFMGGCIDNYTHFFYWGGPNRHDLWENNRRVRLPGRLFPGPDGGEGQGVHRAATGTGPSSSISPSTCRTIPYQGDEKWLQYYRHLPFPRSLYAAFVSTLDERVERLVKYLRGLGPAGTDDHCVSIRQRPFGRGTRPLWRRQQRTVSRRQIQPLRGRHSAAGHHLLARPPARGTGPRAGRPRLRLDAHAGGVVRRRPAQGRADGRSLVPVIRRPTAPSPHDVLQWRLGDQWAVRQGPWKLLHQPNDQADGKLDPQDKEWFLANVEATRASAPTWPRSTRRWSAAAQARTRKVRERRSGERGKRDTTWSRT